MASNGCLYPEVATHLAMSAEEHPTQAVADYATILAHFGNFEGRHMLYLGEGNNTATALAMGAAMLGGMRLTLLTPPGYELPDDYFKQACSLGQETKSLIEQYHDVAKLPKQVDVVYTTRWQTTGTQKNDVDWREKFQPFSITPQLMKHVSKPSGTIFMHDLPAHRGEDVHRDVLEGAQSVVFRQARYKLYSAMSILEWCLV